MHNKQTSVLLALPVLFFTLVKAESAGVATTPRTDPENPILILPPFEIKTDSQLSFGFSIRVVRNQSNMRTLEMQVERVAAGTDADRKRLKPQSQIIAINGKPISDFEAEFTPGSELARIFIGRPEGAMVTLQVIPPGKQKPQTFKILRKTVFHEFNRIGGLPTN